MFVCGGQFFFCFVFAYFSATLTALGRKERQMLISTGQLFFFYNALVCEIFLALLLSFFLFLFELFCFIRGPIQMRDCVQLFLDTLRWLGLMLKTCADRGGLLLWSSMIGNGIRFKCNAYYVSNFNILNPCHRNKPVQTSGRSPSTLT